jgi:predicted acylesterase/phospholipase RssA
MDVAVTDVAYQRPVRRWKPERCDRIALVLQGGGALGAYQAGVFQALSEADMSLMASRAVICRRTPCKSLKTRAYP